MQCGYDNIYLTKKLEAIDLIKSFKKIKTNSLLLLSLLALFVSSSVNGSNLPTLSNDNPIIAYQLEISCNNALVIELGRGMRLYLKNHDAITSIPMASKIMTAVIAIESISSETKITISNISARQTDAADLALKAGEKYSLDYLLYGLILRDNDAAAIALAEQISGMEESFVDLMNTKAIGYQMENTQFMNATGLHNDNQFTTLSDVSRLVRYALTLPKFNSILQTKDIPFFLSATQTKYLINNMELAWSAATDTTGGFRSDSSTHSSFISTAARGPMKILILGNTTDKNVLLDDLVLITESIYSDYEYTTLVRENQIFPKTLNIGSDSFGLRFNNAVHYVRPRDVSFIKYTIYEETALISYPIITTKSIAKVTFELQDGTKISVDLFPDRTLWGESGYYNRILSVYNEHRQISLIIMTLFTLLILMLLMRLIRGIVNLLRSFYKYFNHKRKNIIK
jgi:serine-type D-Ala-D-Ala carboxypeptidase (penicillin-binding protein 5/6)